MAEAALLNLVLYLPLVGIALLTAVSERNEDLVRRLSFGVMVAQFVLAAYLTGSVLTQGFDVQQSRINVLVVSRSLGGTRLDALAKAIPAPGKSGPRFEPLFMTQSNIEKSLDSFPIGHLVPEHHDDGQADHP